MIAAICAAPTALKAHGIGKGKQITSYPAMKNDLIDEYKYLEEKVVTDGNIFLPYTYYQVHLVLFKLILLSIFL